MYQNSWSGVSFYVTLLRCRCCFTEGTQSPSHNQSTHTGHQHSQTYIISQRVSQLTFLTNVFRPLGVCVQTCSSIPLLNYGCTCLVCEITVWIIGATMPRGLRRVKPRDTADPRHDRASAGCFA